MKPKLRKTQKTLRRLKKRSKCPACGSAELIITPADQICCHCDWNTFYEFVETGLMDNVPLALVQHFYDVDMFEKPNESNVAEGHRCNLSEEGIVISDPQLKHIA